MDLANKKTNLLAIVPSDISKILETPSVIQRGKRSVYICFVGADIFAY